MTTAETYVTAAYCVVFGVVLLYVVIIALKLQRLERDVGELEARGSEDRQEDRDPVGASAEQRHG